LSPTPKTRGAKVTKSKTQRVTIQSMAAKLAGGSQVVLTPRTKKILWSKYILPILLSMLISFTIVFLTHKKESLPSNKIPLIPQAINLFSSKSSQQKTSSLPHFQRGYLFESERQSAVGTNGLME